LTPAVVARGHVVAESVGVSREAQLHREQALERFAELIRLEADRLAAAGIVPARDYGLTAVALVGAINGLINTWTADPDWDAHVDRVIAVAAELIVVAITRPL
jgi:hypothetical protein